jgi:hypothetical protein
MSEANKTQIGGDHYKFARGEEHWDRIYRMFGAGYFIGCITKYVERAHLKNGLEDLKKARHFLDKLIELESVAETGGPTPGYVNQDGLEGKPVLPFPHGPMGQAYKEPNNER